MIKIVKKLVEDFSSLDIIDQKKQQETNRKVIHALRVAKEAREAAEEARKQGKDTVAAELEDQAQTLEDWAKGKYDASVEQPGENHFQGGSTEGGSGRSNSNNNAEKRQGSGGSGQNVDDKPEDELEGSSVSDESNDNSDNSDDSSDKSSDDSSKPDDSFNTSGNDSDKSSSSSNKADKSDDSSDKSSNGSDSSSKSNDSSNKSSNGSSKSSKPIKNPFNINPKQTQSGDSQDSQNSNDTEGEEEPELERMKTILKMLKKGEKAGAKDALAKILSDRQNSAETTESLHEKLTISKSIDTISDENFNDIINQVLDTIDSIRPLQYEEPRKVRVDQIKSDVLSTKNIRDLNQEDKANLKPAVKSRENEISKYNLGRAASTDAFKLDLEDAIRDQIDKVKKSKNSWGAINKRHQGTNILKPGTVIRGDWEDKRPLIQVYLDCSGSFDKADVEKEKALLNVLAEFVDQGEIAPPEIYYFAENLYSDYASARAESGTEAWDQIMNQIKVSNATNVLIVTDSDMDDQAAACGYWEVDGCVWYIWKRSKAPNMLTHLTGKQAVKEYKISW